MAKITPRQIFTTQWISLFLHQNFSFTRWEGRFRPAPSSPLPFLLLSGKLCHVFTYQSRGVEIISTDFSAWLWTATQFNISKNEMSLRVLLVIGNGVLIPTWKYCISVWKNERREWPKYTMTSQQFWKLTINELKWCNFKMHVTGLLLIIKY